MGTKSWCLLNIKDITKLLGVNLSSVGLESPLWLGGVNLKGADMYRADFRGTELFTADLSYSNFADANFSNAGLSGADSRFSNLIRANFNGASLIGVDFQGARLEDANFLGADLSGAKLSESRKLTAKQLIDSCGNERTTLPQGIKIPMCEKE